MSRGACLDAELLDLLYRRYNDLRWLSPDPLEVVLEYRRPADQELAALVCASLALGSAPLIVKPPAMFCTPYRENLAAWFPALPCAR